MGTKQIHTNARMIVERHATDVPDVYLVIRTHHSRELKAIHSSCGRQMIRDGRSGEEIGPRIDDPCPAPFVGIPVSRYSLKALENAHANFVSRHVAGVGQFDALKAWAARA